jgi:hypothetical protein
MKGDTSVGFPPVKEPIIIFNNVEEKMDFPLGLMFGEAFVQGITWIATKTVEGFGRDFTRRVIDLKPGQSLLYILDSWDALTSEGGLDRFIEAAEKDKAQEGSYGTEKAAYASKSFFNNVCGLMEGKDVTLLIVSQIREKINVTFGKKHYRAGGKALDFYTHQVVWLAEIEKLSKTFRGEKRVYGIKSKGKFDRNKAWKPFREADMTIIFDYGIDDLSSMIDWFYGPGADQIEFDGQKMPRSEVIRYIEENKLEDVLIEMVEEEWQEIEDAVSPNRRKKYEE